MGWQASNKHGRVTLEMLEVKAQASDNWHICQKQARQLKACDMIPNIPVHIKGYFASLTFLKPLTKIGIN